MTAFDFIGYSFARSIVFEVIAFRYTTSTLEH
jgi:hypothetical protein